MTDDEFLAGFEACTLGEFRHVDHVRLAMLYLRRYGRDGALERLVRGIRVFATAKGAPDKFHYTVTRAWLELVAEALAAAPAAGSVEALVGACPHLLDTRAVERQYPAGALNTPEAREGWVPPPPGPHTRVTCRSRR